MPFYDPYGLPKRVSDPGFLVQCLPPGNDEYEFELQLYEMLCRIKHGLDSENTKIIRNHSDIRALQIAVLVLSAITVFVLLVLMMYRLFAYCHTKKSEQPVAASE